MAADAPVTVLDEAWGHIPQTRATTAGIGSFTRTRVERIISVVTGLAFIVFGIQAFLIALGSDDEQPIWHVGLMIAVFSALVLTIVACLVGRGVRVAASLFVVVYLASLLTWPIATAGIPTQLENAPWIWYLLNVSTLAAVLAFPLPLQIVWTALAPLLFGFVRLIQGGFARDYWIAVGLDVSFALIFGGVLLTLVWVFRSVAANVDETRARAVESYATAAATEAAEQERVAVAALMHDSVLAALISSERADTARAKTLAVAMAREALTRLADAEQVSGEGTDDPRDGGAIADDIAAAARELGAELDIERRLSPDAATVPGRAARALALAATQAVANALEHAGGEGLHVIVEASSVGLRIQVQDRGGGFDLEEVPDDRLGIRASIFARVAAVGGTVAIDSDPFGTTVLIRWRTESAS